MPITRLSERKFSLEGREKQKNLSKPHVLLHTYTVLHFFHGVPNTMFLFNTNRVIFLSINILIWSNKEDNASHFTLWLLNIHHPSIQSKIKYCRKKNFFLKKKGFIEVSYLTIATCKMQSCPSLRIFFILVSTRCQCILQPLSDQRSEKFQVQCIHAKTETNVNRESNNQVQW